MSPSATPETPAPLTEEEKHIAEVERCLKENEAQRTETTSAINQLNIQLHRQQLRLQQLNERRTELQAELGASTVGN